jgi:hypothetical protein
LTYLIDKTFKEAILKHINDKNYNKKTEKLEKEKYIELFNNIEKEYFTLLFLNTSTDENSFKLNINISNEFDIDEL